MSASLKLTNASGYQAYVEEFSPQLLSKLLLGFKTAEIATLHEGVKGKKTLTEVTLGNLVQVWNKSFNATADAIDFTPRTLETYLCKVDLSVYAQELSQTYLGELTRRNAAPEDFPFPEFLVDYIAGKIQQEKELAVFNGERIASVIAGTVLGSVVDGFTHIIADEVTATNMTAVVTGASTITNAIDNAITVYSALGSAYQEKPLYAFCSPAHLVKIKQNWAKSYGAYVGQSGEAFKLPVGDVTFSAHAGITGDKLFMTPKENLHIGYAPEGPMLRFEETKRELVVMSDFWFGCQFGMINNDIIRVNDQ